MLHQYPENKDALCFLVHLVGDFFCPLHIGHESDKGGNTIKMQWFNQNINLHKVWDSYLIESQGYSYNEYAQYLEIQFSSQQQSIEKMTEADFLIHNYHLSCDIYDYQKKWDGNTYHYIYHFVHNMEWQLYAGGIYLACLLNELYK